jgi:hypothetical protein
VKHPSASPEGLPLAGTKIPPRPPGSALGGKISPAKLPGMAGPGPKSLGELLAMKGGAKKAEPGPQGPSDRAAVAGANKQLGGFKSVASNPTAMPGGKLGKGLAVTPASLGGANHSRSFLGRQD